MIDSRVNVGGIVIAVLGLSGVGKSSAVQILRDIGGAPVVYLGGVVLSELSKRGLPEGETSESRVRQELRETFGMAAIALKATPEIQQAALVSNAVIVDGVYSGAEIEVLRREFARVVTVAIHASRATRETRLAKRPIRPLTPEQVRSRDEHEIEQLDKARPIVTADHHIVNDGTLDALRLRLTEMYVRACNS